MSSFTEETQQLNQSGLFIQNSAFIDGEWLERKKTFDVYGIHYLQSHSSIKVNGYSYLIEVPEPSTAQVLGTAANGSMGDMQNAIQSAHNAQQEYFASTTAAARGALLQKWYELVMANMDDCV